MISIFFALGSNISFATASLYFTTFSNLNGPVWMNYFKALIAFICFSIVILIFNINLQLSLDSMNLLIISGLAGLMIGDIFLLKAFTYLGSGRVLMIFGFQPILLGVFSYFLFSEKFTLSRFIALFFLLCCLFLFSLESFKEKGDWQIKGILFALIGVTLDACGLLLTKKAFELSPHTSIFVANAIRSGSTALGFFILSFIPFLNINLYNPFNKMDKNHKLTVILASVFGTFLSLTCYLKAIQIGHLTTVSAIAGTSPLFATIIEVAKGQKKFTLYLLMSSICFIAGLTLLIFF